MSQPAPIGFARPISPTLQDIDNPLRARNQQARLAAEPAEPVLAPDHQVIREIFTNVNIRHGEPTLAEINRARWMIAAHDLSPAQVHRVMGLFVGRRFAPQEYVSDAEIRVGLAALAGIAIGLDPVSGQRLVDRARSKPLNEVLQFVLDQALAVGVIGGYAAVGAWIFKKGAMRSFSAIDAIGRGGALPSSQMFDYWTGIGVMSGGTWVGMFGTYYGMDLLAATRRANPHLTESTWQKDQRIFEGLQRGTIPLPNLPPPLNRP